MINQCKENPDLRIYLRKSDNYIALAHELFEGEGPPIWILRDSETDCPTDNNGPFGFWNWDESRLDVATADQVSWEVKTNPTTSGQYLFEIEKCWNET